MIDWIFMIFILILFVIGGVFYFVFLRKRPKDILLKDKDIDYILAHWDDLPDWFKHIIDSEIDRQEKNGKPD